MLKKLRGLMAFISLLGLSLFLLNCGSSNSRPSGVVFVASQGASTVGSYAIDLTNGKLTQLNTTAPTGNTPTTMILDSSGGVAFLMNAGSDEITAYTVNSDGTLTASGSSTPITVENSVGMARDSAGSLLFVVSQGTIPQPAGCDTATPPAGCPGISIFTMQSGSATLTPVAGSPFLLSRVPVAIAPSISVTLPNPNQLPGEPATLTGPVLYVPNNQDLVGSNDNTVSELVYDTATSILKEVIGSPYATTSDPSAALAVNVTPAGGTPALFVYVTNVTTNNVDIFKVCTIVNADCVQGDVDDAKMIPVGNPVAVGQDPVALTIDSTNNFMYIVNHHSNSVSGFRVNQTTGALAPLTPATVQTGASPFALSLHPSNEFLYVSNNASDNISGFKVSTTNGALSSSTTITSASAPSGIVAK